MTRPFSPLPIKKHTQERSIMNLDETERMFVLFDQYNSDIVSKSEEIDPNDQYGWTELAIGYFLGKGVSVHEAKDLADKARRYFAI